MIELKANGLSLTSSMAQSVIDKAIEDGCDRGQLRWVAGRFALHAIQAYLQVVSDLNTLRYETEHGIPSFGIFAGIPYRFDGSVPDDALWLQVVVEATGVGCIEGLARTGTDIQIYGEPRGA